MPGVEQWPGPTQTNLEPNGKEPHMDAPTPVVFLHAFPLNASMWVGQRAAIRDRATLAPHHPGFGGRPMVDPDLDRYASAAAEEMDAAGLRQAVLVGLSMGGYVALRFQALWPERVAAMVLADTRAGADDEAGRAKRTAQAERARGEGVGWLSEAMLPALLGETTRREREAVVARVRTLVQAAKPEGVARALEAMRGRPDSRPTLGAVRVPVLVVVGEEDTLTPVAESRLIATSVPHARLEVIPGAGHLSNLEAPEAFNRVLLDFLADLPIPTG